MNKFSIIIPVYNAEKYIEKCINSILEQTYKNIEIIVVDDGSTDNSYYICRSLKNDQIKIISTDNLGVSNARNIGIQNATGDYLIFVDCDDWLEDTAIQHFFEIFNNSKNNYDLIISEMALIKDTMKKINKCNMANNDYEIEDLFSKLLKNKKSIERINSVCGKAYKMDIIKNNNIRFDENIQIGEDLLFNIKYLKNVKNIRWSNEVTYNYFIDNNKSVTKKYIENKYDQLMKINDEFNNFLNKFKNKKILKLAKYIRIKNVYSCIFDLSHSGCKYSHKQKIKFIKKIKNNEKEIVLNKMGGLYYFLSIIIKYFPSFLIIYLTTIFKKGKMFI